MSPRRPLFSPETRNRERAPRNSRCSFREEGGPRNRIATTGAPSTNIAHMDADAKFDASQASEGRTFP
jgi:hypothetical protein